MKLNQNLQEHLLNSLEKKSLKKMFEKLARKNPCNCFFLFEGEVPLTSRTAVRCVAPATFETTQVYSPACRADTESIDNCFDRLPDFEIVMSSRSLDIAVPLNIHTISRGRSPFITAQDSDAISPAFAGSSPKVNGFN